MNYCENTKGVNAHKDKPVETSWSGKDDVETHWMKSLSSKLKQQQKQSNHKNLEVLLAARSKTFI